MQSGKKNQRSSRARGGQIWIRDFLRRQWPWLLGLAFFAALAAPALTRPTSAIIAGDNVPGSEARPFSLLILASERLLSLGHQPAAWPGYPRTNQAPADTPGPIASLIAAPAVGFGQPVLAWNLTTILIPWLTLLSMILLCRAATENSMAASIAGLGYAVQPVVLLEPTSTFLLLSPLLPAIILSTHDALENPTRSAPLRFFCVALGLVWAPLPIAITAAIASSIFALQRHARTRLLAGKLIGCLIVFGFLRMLLHPQLLLPADPVALVPAGDPIRSFLPGGTWGPGAVVSGLALIALLDRIRGVRRAPMGDPRLLLLCAVVVLPAVLADHAGGPEGSRYLLPGAWLESGYPVVNSLRWCLRLLLPLSWCSLAAFGALALLERLAGHRTRMVVTAGVLGGLFLGNFLYPPQPLGQAPAQTRHLSFLSPPNEEARLLEQAGQGALLDLPLGAPDPAAHRLLASAWHRRATTLASADGKDPAQALAPFAAALSRPDGAEALATLGFGNILIHKHDLSPEAYANLLRSLARSGGAEGRLTTQFESSGHLLLGLQGAFPVSENFDVLESNQTSASKLTLTGPEDLLVFELRVRSDLNFRNPEPEKQIPLRVEFFDFRRRLVSEHLVSGLIPVAVAQGGTGYTALRLPLPGTPGLYTARLAPEADPALTLAIQSLEILPSPEPH